MEKGNKWNEEKLHKSNTVDTEKNYYHALQENDLKDNEENKEEDNREMSLERETQEPKRPKVECNINAMPLEDAVQIIDGRINEE